MYAVTKYIQAYAIINQDLYILRQRNLQNNYTFTSSFSSSVQRRVEVATVTLQYCEMRYLFTPGRKTWRNVRVPQPLCHSGEQHTLFIVRLRVGLQQNQLLHRYTTYKEVSRPQSSRYAVVREPDAMLQRKAIRVTWVTFCEKYKSFKSCACFLSNTKHILIMRRCHSGRSLKALHVSVRPSSVCYTVSCLRFSRNQNAVETSNWVERHDSRRQ